LIGSSATQPLLDNLGAFAPGPAKDIVANAIRGLAADRGTASVLFFVGLAAALWSASGYIGFRQHARLQDRLHSQSPVAAEENGKGPVSRAFS
jgi:uncharacterized BrkB/YihY/UPF0761 family membrane protein